MNHAQILYLGSYFRIDCIDHVIQNASTGNPARLRLCGDLTHLQNHTNADATVVKHLKVCHICGKPA
jgi:hypothetical protein